VHQLIRSNQREGTRPLILPAALACLMHSVGRRALQRSRKPQVSPDGGESRPKPGVIIAQVELSRAGARYNRSCGSCKESHRQNHKHLSYNRSSVHTYLLYNALSELGVEETGILFCLQLVKVLWLVIYCWFASL
jgi:hypothetical protein